MPVSEGTTIRHAYPSDVPTILRFIHELAAYEKEPPSTVEATLESLSNTIAFATPPPSLPSQSVQSSTPAASSQISQNRPARCLLLFTSSGEAAGMALYFYNYSTWRSKAGIYLEDLYVAGEYRGSGFGQALLGRLAKETVDMGGVRLEWSVLKWNQPSISFYEGKSVGAERMEGWVGMRVSGENLVELAKKGI